MPTYTRSRRQLLVGLTHTAGAHGDVIVHELRRFVRLAKVVGWHPAAVTLFPAPPASDRLEF